MLGISKRLRVGPRPLLSMSTGLVIGTLLLAACSSSTTDGDSSSDATVAPTEAQASASAAPGGESDAMALALAGVAAAKAVPTYNGPTTPLDTSLLQGKTVYIINSLPNNAFQDTMIQNFKEATGLMGMEVVALGDSNPAQQTAFVNQAVDAKAAGIVLLSIGDGQVSTALQNAEDAGIPVITMAQTSAGTDPGKNIDNSVNVDLVAIGKAQVDLAFVLSDGYVNGIGYGGEVLPQDVTQWQGQQERIKELCPDTCKYSSQNIDLNTFQTQLPSVATAAMVADPELNWFFPTWDILGGYLVPAIESQGKTGEVRWTAWNGIPAAMELVRDGKQTATFGAPLRWWGYATADMIGRYIAGQEVAPDAENLPFRLIDKEVLDAAGTIDDESKLYEDESVIEQYKTLWGVN